MWPWPAIRALWELSLEKVSGRDERRVMLVPGAPFAAGLLLPDPAHRHAPQLRDRQCHGDS